MSAVWALAAASAILTGCASEPQMTREQLEAIDSSIGEAYVYLETIKPPEVTYFRFAEPLRYEILNGMFVVVEGYSAYYLVEFRKYCNELLSVDVYTDMADVRSRRGMLRSGLDTIRTCRIRAIYELPPEPEALPEGTGSPNTEPGAEEQNDDEE